jgi:hypothetical protein
MPVRPPYEGLDHQGYPEMRVARTVGELPLEDIATALTDATQALSGELGMPALDKIKSGLPVGLAFMTRPEIKKHPRAKLLATLGTDLSLDHCPSYSES